MTHGTSGGAGSVPSSLRIGALCWNQYTDWPALLAAGQRADRLGYDSLWTWDHLCPIVGHGQAPGSRRPRSAL